MPTIVACSALLVKTQAYGYPCSSALSPCDFDKYISLQAASEATGGKEEASYSQTPEQDDRAINNRRGEHESQRSDSTGVHGC